LEKEKQKEKKLQKELWGIGNTIFWSLNTVILLAIILDVIILRNNWLDFVILKLLLLLSFYFTYNIFRKKYTTPNILIHLVLFFFNFLSLISISYSDIGNRIVYTSLIIILFVAFNSIVIWSIVNSFIQYLLVIITFIILVSMDVITNPAQILREGGYLFLSLGFISFFFPKIRKKVLIERIDVEIRADEKNNYLAGELSETKSNYALLQKKVLKKENESKFLFQQISSDLNDLSETLTRVEDSCSEKEKKDLDSLIQNLRNQSSIYFKPININTVDKKYSTERVDVKQIYLEIFKSFENKIKEKNITGVDHFLATNTLILGNEKVFKTILYNILNFMVTFSNENEDIEVTIDNRKDETVFSVSNKTAGIETAEIESYFRDLEFVNYDYKKHSDSLKIGLRISKQLTEKMKGYFSFVSSIKMGFELKIQFKTYKQK
jgi:signal transduction histidine kinase